MVVTSPREGVPVVAQASHGGVSPNSEGLRGDGDHGEKNEVAIVPEIATQPPQSSSSSGRASMHTMDDRVRKSKRSASMEHEDVVPHTFIPNPEEEIGDTGGKTSDI